jgi:hypothetical protein
MTEILDVFTVIGFCTTIYLIVKFLDEILDERKKNKLADETSRRLREEHRHEQLKSEWSNMTTAGNKRAVFIPKIGRWVVFDKPNAP